MKINQFSTFACLLLCGAFLPSAFANHRTGTLILPEVLAAGDLNGDGNLDIAVNATGFDNVAIFLGDGHGQFTLIGHVASDTLPKGLAIGDMNRDGHLDLVQCNNWGYNAVVHLGDGLGGFGERDVVVNAEGGPNRVVLADFNNDRNLDMAVAGPDEGVILIYLGDGKGGFALPAEEIGGLKNNRELIAADFNGDGKVDIATATAPNVQVFLGDGTGSFALSAVLNSVDAANLGASDLNKDGKLDLVVGGTGPGSKTKNYISTYLGDGTGSFVLKQTVNLGKGDVRGELAVADFNEDGNPDVAFPLVNVLIYSGDGTGNLVAAPPLKAGDQPHSVVAADFNNDGHQDLADTNRGVGTVSVFLGDGRGKFTLSTTVSVLCPTCLE
ncbi:MAG: FG-GAP repeat domain-containing protein [Chthoniobacterales bacterium]